MMVRRLLILSVVLFSLVSPELSAAEQAEIVWVIDVSGSVRQADSQRVWRDAVLAGVDLLPPEIKMSLIAANDSVVTRIPQDAARERREWKDLLESVPVSGDTDLTAGLEAALGTIADGAQNQIILIADISEGGFLAPGINSREKLAGLDGLAQRFHDQNVSLNCFFLGSSRANETALGAWEELAKQSGGRVHYLSRAEELTESVAEIYFLNRSGPRLLIDSVGTAGEWRTIRLTMPDVPLSSACLYIPGADVKAQDADVRLTTESTYAVLKLTPPLPAKLMLEIRPAAATTQISLLLDGSYEINLTHETSIAGRNILSKGTQEETVVFAVRETASGAAFGEVLPENIEAQAMLTGPDGLENPIDLRYDGGNFSFTFRPLTFGDYTLDFSADFSGATRIISATGSFSIEETPLSPLIWRVLFFLLVICAALFAVYTTWREKMTQTIASGRRSSSGEPLFFDGELNICALIFDGGSSMLPRSSCRLSGADNLTLSQAFEKCGLHRHYPDGDAIVFRPAGKRSVILQNNSKSPIICLGRKLERGQEEELSWGQKVYVIFTAGKDEFEISYDQTVSKVETSAVYLEKE
jgi:Mg-chelatase subunit ChlD